MKKSQLWYMDFISGLTIFTFTLLIAFNFVTNDKVFQGKETSTVLREADKLSTSLMGPGIPLNWTEANVVIIGIVSEDNELEIDKLEMFRNLTENDYEYTRQIMGLDSDYIIFFEKVNGNKINITDQTFIGKPGATLMQVNSTDSKEITTVLRYLSYKQNNVSEIIGMKVIVWQD